MFTATRTGVAQTRTRPEISRRRTNWPSFTNSNAISVPKTIVKPTFTAVKTTVRRRTVQNWWSWKIRL
jgi:hypothetical protein